MNSLVAITRTKQTEGEANKEIGNRKYSTFLQDRLWLFSIRLSSDIFPELVK
jgi:hypothetical protein